MTQDQDLNQLLIEILQTLRQHEVELRDLKVAIAPSEQAKGEVRFSIAHEFERNLRSIDAAIQRLRGI
jgi:hypothetical protein